MKTQRGNAVRFYSYHHHLHDSNFTRKSLQVRHIWMNGGFIKLSTGQSKYIPLVVNHREISGTVEGGREEETERKTVSSLGQQRFEKSLMKTIHVCTAVLYSLSLHVFSPPRCHISNTTPPPSTKGTKRKAVFTQMKTFSPSTEVQVQGGHSDSSNNQRCQSQNSTSLNTLQNAHIRHQLPGDHVCGNIFLPFSLLLLLFRARAESSVFTDEPTCRAGGQTEHAFPFQAKTSPSRDGHVSLCSARLALTHHNIFSSHFARMCYNPAHLQVRPTLVPPSTEQKSQVASGRRTKQLIKQR